MESCGRYLGITLAPAAVLFGNRHACNLLRIDVSQDEGRACGFGGRQQTMFSNRFLCTIENVVGPTRTERGRNEQEAREGKDEAHAEH